MATAVQLRRGTTTQNNAFTGALGEVSVDTTLDTIRVHDGSTAGGFEITSNAATQTLTNKSLTAPTLTGTAVMADLDISGDVDVDGTLETDALTIGGVTLAETISDTVGAMVGSNTETGITVTYQDGDNTLDFALGAAQTTITSLLATDIKIGEDDQTKIDFETADEIHFYAANAHQIKLVDGALVPVTDNDIDLGTSSLEFKDAFFDGTVTADAFAGPLTGNVTGNASGTALTVTQAAQSAITSLGTLTTLTVDNVIINGSTIGHTGDTDLITVASGIVTVAGEVSLTTLDIGGTNVTSTAAEINLIDGGTARGTTAVATGDGILINDGGTMRMTNVDTVSTYFSSHNVGGGNIVTTGALNSGSITSGFGAINNGSSAITTTGVGSFGSLDISGNIDIDGTTNLDAVDIDGAVQLDATLTIGANDQGYDVILHGDTASANITFDTSADDLIFNGAAGLIVPDGQFTLGSTAVTSTAAELNLLDGVSGLVQADFTKLAAVDATAAELNILDDATLTVAELNILDASAGNTALATDVASSSGAGTTNTAKISHTLTLAAELADDATHADVVITNNKVLATSVVLASPSIAVDVLVHTVVAGSFKVSITNKSGGALADDSTMILNYRVI